MTSMDDPTAFLRARLDERADAAKRMAEVYPEPWDVADRGWMARVVADGPNFPEVVRLDQNQAPENADWLGGILEHVVLNAPSNVLAEVDAKRRIIELLHREFLDDGEETWGDILYVEKFLKLLALPYAGHPDYREEWRP